MQPYQKFETERLILQPTSLADAAFIQELLNSPKWLQYIGDRNVKTIEDAQHYVRTKILPQFKRLGYGTYTLIRKADNNKIGTCGLFDRDGLEGIDIGFALLPGYEGKGYAFEAALKLKNVAYSEFGITSIDAITTKDNLASQKLLEKLGLQKIGTTRLPNEEEELLLYRTPENYWLF